MKSTYILKEVIEEINKDPKIKQVDDDIVIMRELCNKIQKEENGKMDKEKLENFLKNSPSGAMIFLTLSIPYQRNKKEVSYITLENDGLDGWCVCYYVDFGGTGVNKLKKRHDIDSINPNHVMTKFAKIYKLYLGKEINNL